jgi:hypothetical protein
LLATGLARQPMIDLALLLVAWLLGQLIDLALRSSGEHAAFSAGDVAVSVPHYFGTLLQIDFGYAFLFLVFSSFCLVGSTAFSCK